MSDKKIVELEIRVTNQIAYKDDSSWGSYGVLPTNLDDYPTVEFNKYGNMAISGVCHKLVINGVYNLKAELSHSPTYGAQYKIIRVWQDMPSTPEQQFEFLRAFVTPLQFESIYKVYGDQDIIDMFKNDTFDYKLVHGMGQFTYDLTKKKVLDNIQMMELVNEFPELSFNILKRILNKFDTTEIMVQKLKENPYILTTLGGIGFKTADDVALKMGFKRDNPMRIRAAIFHCVREVENNGDTYIYSTTLINKAFEFLGVNKSLITEELDNTEEIVRIDKRFALRETLETEVIVSEKLITMKQHSNVLEFNVADFIVRMEHKYKIKLTDQQKEFFYNFLKENVTFLIGYAGTGKSMLQKLLIEMLKELALRYVLLAPTGKAAKVLGGYTGEQAWTIHRRTGMGKDFAEQELINLYEDVIIVDESSMCGVTLVKILLLKIKNPNARILFLGDSFQIPSVDKGNFLYDCQESGVFLTAKLDIVFRQSEGGILDIATKVRLGQRFIDSSFSGIKEFGNNCILVACPQDKMERGYMHYYKSMVEKYGEENVMTLSPTKKGNLGTFAVNRTLQAIANPKIDEYEPEIKMTKDKQEIFFRVGDQVINTVNSYNMKAKDSSDDEPVFYDIMNGDTGIIVEMDAKNRVMYIDFDGAIIVYLSADIDKLLHSHCLTMHKSQGSAADAVISITDKAHTFQLNANLLYVAWTRPTKFLVILCQPATINSALKEFENLRRNTFLCEILKGEIDYSEIFPDAMFS